MPALCVREWRVWAVVLDPARGFGDGGADPLLLDRLDVTEEQRVDVRYRDIAHAAHDGGRDGNQYIQHLEVRFSARALSICTMTDCLVTGEELDADERQSSLEDIARVALDVAVADKFDPRKPR